MSQIAHAPGLLTIDEVLHLTGYKSRTSIYRLIRQKRCPPPVVIGGGRVRWHAHDIQSWLQQLPIQNYR
ncbi:helix-turn-helix transcriptional regulator [Sphingomonas sanguinis]|uniref:helix-turn-helix transcriptional regulator n=1 Tax=Sphingomonas sanguinis TaxID=33051 RepID=UPI0039997648